MIENPVKPFFICMKEPEALWKIQECFLICE